MYVVTAQCVLTTSDGWDYSHQLPAFFVQADNPKTARDLADDIVGAKAWRMHNIRFHIDVQPL